MMHPTLRGWMVIGLLGSVTAYCIAEEITLTTYYPSPRGVYNELRTLGDVRLGDLSAEPPKARLHVVQEAAKAALRVDDEPPFGLLYDATPFVIDQDGNVGIGTASPGKKLDVQGGDINASGKLMESGSALIPKGAVMFFNLAACPSGWTELTAARGRYLLGLPAPGTLAATVGTALSDTENRAVGQHTHTLTDPRHSHPITDQAHTHQYAIPSLTNQVGLPRYSAGPYDIASGVWQTTQPEYTHITGTEPSGTNISINAEGSVAGTNAPYIQLLVCQKN